ncbi:MAG TPA: glycosyltransferase family 2 protein [Tepidisphaeraceae bacterium]|jgi:dolichol-phosphate mannosyltransferase|nr:glycosyltransferase family 2 protein [Tepidisphaeraceae bacterium]
MRNLSTDGVSVVVPVYNEEENLHHLRRRMTAAMDGTGRPWELILVDDGSRDGSVKILTSFHEEDPRIKVVRLSRNFGHQSAVTAGIHHANGGCVVLIDGDLQDPPEVIPKMVAKWAEGYHVVLGERTSRQDGGLRGMGFTLFYPIMRYVSDLPDGPDAGIFGLMDRRVVEEFNKLPERNRFIPGLRTWLGFSSTSVTYARQERAAGQPKQTMKRLLRYALNGMFSFSYKPLRVATYMGFLASAVAFLIAVYFFITFFAFNKQAGSGFTTIIISVLFVGGVQLITVGILGEYIGRIYEEVKQRPLYVVDQRLGFDGRSATAAASTTGDGVATSGNDTATAKVSQVPVAGLNATGLR